MFMKKAFILLSAVLVVLFAFLSSGAKFTAGKISLTVLYRGKKVLSKTYDLETSGCLSWAFRYGWDMNKFYENEGSGSSISFLRNLNGDLTRDISELKRYGREKKEPVAIFGDGKFTYLDGVVGTEPDVEKLGFDIIKNFSRNVTVSLKEKIIRPEKDREELLSETKKISEFSTSFATSGKNRRYNIKLAAGKLNNLEIPPGGALSFNAAVGERTAKNGFKDANIISDGKFVSGTGGGVCQVSTTLYNVWIRAGLAVEKSSPHSLPVSYVPPALDAMVSSSSDLILRNDSVYAVYISAETEEDGIRMVLYGKPPECEIKLRSKITAIIKAVYEEEYSDELEEGETERIIRYPKDGLISESYREFYKGGELLYREKLRTCKYLPQNGKKYILRPTDDAAFAENAADGGEIVRRKNRLIFPRLRSNST